MRYRAGWRALRRRGTTRVLTPGDIGRRRRRLDGVALAGLLADVERTTPQNDRAPPAPRWSISSASRHMPPGLASAVRETVPKKPAVSTKL